MTIAVVPRPADLPPVPTSLFPVDPAVRFRGHLNWARSTTALHPVAMPHLLKRPLLRSLSLDVDSEYVGNGRHDHDNLPGPRPEYFAQGSARFSGRSPETTIPVVNA